MKIIKQRIHSVFYLADWEAHHRTCWSKPTAGSCWSWLSDRQDEVLKVVKVLNCLYILSKWHKGQPIKTVKGTFFNILKNSIKYKVEKEMFSSTVLV